MNIQMVTTKDKNVNLANVKTIPLVVSLSNHERAVLRQAQGKRLKGYFRDNDDDPELTHAVLLAGSRLFRLGTYPCSA